MPRPISCIRPFVIAPVVALIITLPACSQDTGELRSTPEPDETLIAQIPGGSSERAAVRGSVPIAEGGLPSFLVLLPDPPRDFAPPEYAPSMDQVALTFLPSILFARTNQPVTFWNNDDVLHNVRVFNAVTKAPSFNVAIPTGRSYEHTFTEDGFYDVGCDIHPGMTALVFVTSTPYAVQADSEGRFELHDVVPGTYVATVYAGAHTIERVVDVTVPLTTLTIE